jgi:hypothetical protein
VKPFLEIVNRRGIRNEEACRITWSGQLFELYGGDGELLAVSNRAQRLSSYAFGLNCSSLRHDYHLRLAED